jgi:lysozyme
MNRDRLKRQLEIDEDRRKKAYRCSAGFLSIGVGRNLDANGLRDKEIDFMLENDIDEVVALLDKHLPWWKNMTDARREVLANMCFNLGIGKLLGFKNTLAFMEQGRYEAAARGMEASMWYRQVGDRAKRLVKMMEEG